MSTYRTSRGRPLPLGASAAPESVNFALLCRHGETVTLVILPDGTGEPLLTYELDKWRNKTGDHWHVSVYGLPSIFCYGWRVTGPRWISGCISASLSRVDQEELSANSPGGS